MFNGYSFTYGQFIDVNSTKCKNAKFKKCINVKFDTFGYNGYKDV